MVSAPQAGSGLDESMPELAMLAHLHVDSPWRQALARELKKPYMRSLDVQVTQARARKKVYPPPEQVFAAFNYTSLADVRVVILGQDPYINHGQAHGFCFSVPHGVAVPPSLKNIYTELREDVPGFTPPEHGNLESWARQGVFLLNASLTVDAGAS